MKRKKPSTIFLVSLSLSIQRTVFLSVLVGLNPLDGKRLGGGVRDGGAVELGGRRRGRVPPVDAAGRAAQRGHRGRCTTGRGCCRAAGHGAAAGGRPGAHGGGVHGDAV